MENGAGSFWLYGNPINTKSLRTLPFILKCVGDVNSQQEDKLLLSLGCNMNGNYCFSYTEAKIACNTFV